MATVDASNLPGLKVTLTGGRWLFGGKNRWTARINFPEIALRATKIKPFVRHFIADCMFTQENRDAVTLMLDWFPSAIKVQKEVMRDAQRHLCNDYRCEDGSGKKECKEVKKHNTELLNAAKRAKHVLESLERNYKTFEDALNKTPFGTN